MKWFFAGLLVLNVAFLAWNWQQVTAFSSPTVAPANTRLEKDTGLRLLSELKAKPAARPVAEAPVVEPESQPEAPVVEQADATVAESPTHTPSGNVPEPVIEPPKLLCLRLATLESRAQAQDVVAALKQGAADRIREGTETGSKKRYWVLLPPAGSAAATSTAIERLKKAGIKDYYLVRSGEYKNAISLGLFSSPDSAQRRLRQMRDLKLKPRIEETSVATERWWVEFDWPEQRPESQWRGHLPKALQKVVSSPCQ